MSDNVLIAEMVRLTDECDEAIRQRDELRAVLAPLLTSRRDDCLFCGVKTLVGGRMHRSDCPVLRRDALLGRDRAPAHPEGDAT